MLPSTGEELVPYIKWAGYILTALAITFVTFRKYKKEKNKHNKK